MEALSKAGSLIRPTWVLATLALPLLVACATIRPAEKENPSDDEMVDIGYGSVGEDNLTGSVDTEYGRDQPVVHEMTLARMLAKIPGVMVTDLAGGGVSVRIRGTNSFLAGLEPLYVIDGMVVGSGGGAFGINPSTIESVTVLKDAGSTAIYGSRGANGVILIKTKGGSGG
jgi:TonB-dependent SusC/RagA subfamily outer membrane receptor